MTTFMLTISSCATHSLFLLLLIVGLFLPTCRSLALDDLKTSQAGMSSQSSEHYQPRVAVLGAGAAGLACARALTRASGCCELVVLEKDDFVGGVWKYVANAPDRPMYRGLRTNLPKEIMAYRELPWIGPEESYLPHSKVQAYLESYAKEFELPINFQCCVRQLKVLNEKSCFSPEDEDWPKVELVWTRRPEAPQGENKQDNCLETQVFDAVFIANGHYGLPSIPEIPGLREHFKGQTIHAVSYDDPKDFSGQVVLCLGAHASGSDLAREIATHGGAKHVYLSHGKLTDGQVHRVGPDGRLSLVPRTTAILPSGAVQFDHYCPEQPIVDTIICCTGYDFDFPFIQKDSGVDLEAKDRRVTPLFEQLWHARFPNLAFVGLPYAILPFPLFEFQAQAAFETWLHPERLPSLEARLVASAQAAVSGGEGKEDGRIPQDTHFLGSAQWDYCRRLARYADAYDEATEDYLRTNVLIWDHSSMERNGAYPGSPDEYRETLYSRNEKEPSFQIIRSVIEEKRIAETRGQ